MKQQIIVSGIGGQGVLFLTQVVAQVAVDMGLAVFTAETHGMAQRGGTVLSTVKIGDFHSPLIRSGQADVGLLLWEANMPVHRRLIKPNGRLVVNADRPGMGVRIDATGLAREMGNVVLSNLIMLGIAVRENFLFCTAEQCEEAIRALAPSKFVVKNLVAFQKGLTALMSPFD